MGEQKLKENCSNEESKAGDESPYWSWMADTWDAQADFEDYLERINKDDSNNPHEEEKSEQVVHAFNTDLEKEVLAIKRAMNPEELLKWVLDSCQLGLIPSTDILKKLLLAQTKKEEVYQPKVHEFKLSFLPDELDQKPSSIESDSCSDKKPEAITDNWNEKDSYWDERPEPVTDNLNEKDSYWDERPELVATDNWNEKDSYWDETPNTSAVGDSCFEDAPTTKIKDPVQSVANDNDRASIAAYYMSMLNKDASLSTTSTINEDEERASLAAYYRQSMTQQVKVNVTPVVQKSSLVQNSSTVEVDDTLNDHGGYWDETPEVNRGNEEENYWDENPEVNHEMHEEENYWY